MGSKSRNLLIMAAVFAAVIMIIGCIFVLPRMAASPAPQPTEVIETEDCDDEDKAKRDWIDCGIGVLKPSKKPSIKAPAVPAPVRTTKKRP